MKAADPPDVLIGRQSLLRVAFLEQIGAAQVQLFVGKKITKLTELDEPANHRLGRRFRAGGMGNDGHKFMVASLGAPLIGILLYPMLDDHEQNTTEAKRAKAIADEARAALAKKSNGGD